MSAPRDPMRVAMRVDASVRIGSGHLMRCLTLAASLREAGVRVVFVTREQAGNPVWLIEAQGFACTTLPPAEAGADDATGYGSWLRGGWQRDAEETAFVLRELGGVDWLVVDHYGIDRRWEARLRPHAGRVMVIDDLAIHSHECDLLLDQNLYADLDTRHQGLVPAACTLLLGPRYALLRPEFSRQREAALARVRREPYRLLVFYGGVDGTDESGKFLEGWARARPRTLTADLVIGLSNPHAQALAQRAALLPGVRVHGRIDDMAALMAQADYAFGASGVTNWERFCVGLNSSITCVADNQVILTRHLHVLGLIEHLGDWYRTSPQTYESALLRLQPSEERLVARRHQLMCRVDGLGTRRVVQRLTDNPEPGDETENAD